MKKSSNDHESKRQIVNPLSQLQEITLKQVHQICLNEIAWPNKVLKVLAFASANLNFATLFVNRDASLVV